MSKLPQRIAGGLLEQDKLIKHMENFLKKCDTTHVSEKDWHEIASEGFLITLGMYYGKEGIKWIIQKQDDKDT